MHDQLRVRMRDRVDYLQQQAQARRQGQLPALAEAIDAFTFHVLEDQIGLPVLAHPRIEQPRDVRV